MDVSIIIVNYNTAQLTLQCIESIYSKTSKLVYEIIVVDNASTDNSVELIRDKFPNVLLVQSDVNLGFGRANNLAYQSALGNYTETAVPLSHPPH
ncbi:glycosyltransferase [Bacteroides cellulosilyticus]|uniref:glycosyltransferase n=1 Tax=Bacteroides cellulosilyticus TaxID=246787 RepID=UPI0032ED3E32